MPKFKFIHAADLHIESPYRGVGQMNEQLGKALTERGVRAYDKLIQTVIDKDADFMLISGDSFDSESGSLSAQYRFIKGFEKLNEKNIPVFIICGNHDPLNSWSKHLKLPQNVTLFEADEVQQHTVVKNGISLAEIYGVSFGKKEEYRSFAKEYIRNDNASFAIGMLHGSVAGNNAHVPYCPFELATLRNSNMNYWALGHIHKREILNEKDPLIVYPGNLQGRHFNETGEKGCSLVTVEKGKVIEHDFISISEIVYGYYDLDISEFQDVSEFFGAISELKSDKLTDDKSHLLRIRLKGKSELHSVFSDHTAMGNLTQEINEEINYQSQFVFIDKFINESLPIINLEERKKSSDFIADMLNRFEEYENNEEMAEQLFDDVFKEIANSKVGRALNQTDFKDEIMQEKQQILLAAKWKCVDGLIKNEQQS